MDTKKRFVNTRIWESEWYMKLSVEQKLLWNFINDHCNNIGLWGKNLTLASMHIGSKIDSEIVDSFFKIVNSGDDDQLIEIKNNWFLTDFVKFQFCGSTPLTRKCIPHDSYLKLMESCNLKEWFCENRPEIMPFEELKIYHEFSLSPSLEMVLYSQNDNENQGYGKGTHTLKEKETVEDKGKESDKEEEKKTDTDIEEDTPVTIGEIVTETLSIFPNKKNDIQFDENVKCSKIIEHYLESGDTLENIRIHLKEDIFKCKERKLSLNDSLDYIHSSMEVQNEKALG